MATATRIKDKHLTCSICFEFYRTPKTLPCMHSFCEHCLDNHIEAKSKENGFGCPMCNTFTSIPDPTAPPHQWASQFRTDFKLTGMLEELQLIEQEGKLTRDVTQLNKVIENLEQNEVTLLSKIDDDKQTLARLSREQEGVNQQITDVYSTLRLKLQRKEEALKETLRQMCSQRKDAISRSWLSKQKLIDQVATQIEEAERILGSKVSDETNADMKMFQRTYSQFSIGMGGIRTVTLPKLEINMKPEDIVKFDSLQFCELNRESRDSLNASTTTKTAQTPNSSKTKPAPKPPASKPSDPTLSGSSSSLSSSSGSIAERRPNLVTVLEPNREDSDKDPDYQDVVVLRNGQTQVVVLSDYNNKKVVALYVQQGTKTQKSVKLDTNPGRLCKLDTSKIGVSCSDPYKIVLLEVFPEFKQVGTIKSTLNNTGITALSPSTLAIAAKNKINVITTSGSVLKEFKIKSDSSFYAMSWYMVTTPTGSIIVSDRYGEMVSCVTPTGQTLWQWKTPDSTPPAGVSCDKQGRIYVVLTGKKEVHRLSETGQFLGVVLNKDDGLALPTAIEIDQFGQWYIMKKSRQIQVFKQ